MNRKFDINKVLIKYNLDKNFVGKILFPTVRFSRQAFDRIIKYEAELTVIQLEILANHIGCTINDLFIDDEQWRSKSDSGLMTFIKGDYTVKLNYDGVFVTICKGKDVVEHIIQMPSLTLRDFLSEIDTVIKKLEENGN